MSYQCKIVADSLAENGCRLTTFEVTYPLIVHSEIMTHRVFSRNVASNRAIPIKKLIESVKTNPFIPERWPANKAGMQNDTWLEGDDAIGAEAQWLYARDSAVRFAQNLGEDGYGVHKQITNRLLAPFLWTTAVITATEWKNFFSLRCHPMAQPEIQKIAYMMKEAYEDNPVLHVEQGDWHLPYITDETYKQLENQFAIGTCIGNNLDKFLEPFAIKTSAGRCARVSYLTHGDNNTPEKDVYLCVNNLEKNRHMSPLEHPATPLEDDSFCGNFRGWKQYRKFIDGERGDL